MSLGSAIWWWQSRPRCHNLTGRWNSRPSGWWQWGAPLVLNMPERAIVRIAHFNTLSGIHGTSSAFDDCCSACKSGQCALNADNGQAFKACASDFCCRSAFMLSSSVYCILYSPRPYLPMARILKCPTTQPGFLDWHPWVEVH